jgi:hypothetical protein
MPHGNHELTTHSKVLRERQTLTAQAAPLDLGPGAVDTLARPAAPVCPARPAGV